MNHDEMLEPYAQIEPITRAIKASRQSARRHYGVHPYFTRRPPNVVRSYILHYTRPGDRVLDPFGGSGVTAIEAFLAGRRGIQNDINPLCNFIAQGIAESGRDSAEYVRLAFKQVDQDCGDLVRAIPRLNDKEVQRRLTRVPLPENIPLPKSADVEFFFDLFTPRQLLALAVLKQSILRVADKDARHQLLLAWSATLGKLNRTFLSARGRAESRGGSSIFSIYRYKVAKNTIELPPWQTFAERVGNVLIAKEEVLKEIRYQQNSGSWNGSFEAYNLDVVKLPEQLDPVDYIFTDPPYGGHIAYLDLSTIWNHWLGLKVTSNERKSEIIVGGELEKTEEEYIERLQKSIRACVHLLKRGRWLSVVFQHWNTKYFEAILEAAGDGGAPLRAAVTQAGDTIWSMHKKKNRERVLAGEMILSFCHEGKLRAAKPQGRQLSARDLLDELLRQVAPDNGGLYAEVLFNRFVCEAWHRKSLKALKLTREEFLELLAERGWRYDPKEHYWTQAQSSKQRELTF